MCVFPGHSITSGPCFDVVTGNAAEQFDTVGAPGAVVPLRLPKLITGEKKKERESLVKFGVCPG